MPAPLLRKCQSIHIIGIYLGRQLPEGALQPRSLKVRPQGMAQLTGAAGGSFLIKLCRSKRQYLVAELSGRLRLPCEESAPNRHVCSAPRLQAACSQRHRNTASTLCWVPSAGGQPRQGRTLAARCKRSPMRLCARLSWGLWACAAAGALLQAARACIVIDLNPSGESTRLPQAPLAPALCSQPLPLPPACLCFLVCCESLPMYAVTLSLGPCI